MQSKNRIDLNDDIQKIIYKISEGNPGALTVIMRSIKEVRVIDPDSALCEYGPLLLLDSFGIYGSNIWVLYKDCCLQEIVLFLACLRALQLGLISDSEIDDAILNNGLGFDPKYVLEKVQKELPCFAKGFKKDEV